MAKDGFTTVRVKDSVHAQIMEIKSPGETVGQCIERAIGALAQVKDIARRFCESAEYQDYLKSKVREK